VTRALAPDVPVIELTADADDDTLNDAIRSVEVVVNCAQAWSPARRLKYRRSTPPSVERIVEAARRAEVRRIVHVSTAGVFGPNPKARVNEKTRPHPVHVYGRLRLREEQWLLEAAGDLEVVVLRPGTIFGVGEDWILPRLMASMATGRLWLPGGGRAVQTFVSAADVGRACLAAGDRGRPGHAYLIGGFDATWRDLLEASARTAGFAPEIGSVPYQLAYMRALAAETVTPEGAVVWPGIHAVDVIGRSHLLDDSGSRRQLTWSPSVGSFEQEMPAMAGWLSGLPEVAALLSSAPAQTGVEATSPPGR